MDDTITRRSVSAGRIETRVQPVGNIRLDWAMVVPIVAHTSYFLTVQLTVGIWWSIHRWLGVTVLAGVTGWLLSYLLMPPPLPAEPPLWLIF